MESKQTMKRIRNAIIRNNYINKRRKCIAYTIVGNYCYIIYKDIITSGIVISKSYYDNEYCGSINHIKVNSLGYLGSSNISDSGFLDNFENKKVREIYKMFFSCLSVNAVQEYCLGRQFNRYATSNMREAIRLIFGNDMYNQIMDKDSFQDIQESEPLDEPNMFWE